MKRVILLFVSLAVMAFQLLFAQSFTVKGKVIAEEGNEPLIGVAIMQERRTKELLFSSTGTWAAVLALKASVTSMQRASTKSTVFLRHLASPRTSLPTEFVKRER